ncbi:50S ribosomal protein L15 [Salinivirga cyanobacteriivorans]|uniref:Large ribosomal subunit protein uL15 n=1 Tax=Salinivirga cyanobacteriivorans TaxID=1307839 RepID=A0A0S2I2R9_9BACT|nr:50S ribosomal protein L15 [Salinivirga cyanobacteriivorans]ALO16681.1 50S ribosomal protein L15 [Salinivirga cyanobacteriivorans]
MDLSNLKPAQTSKSSKRLGRGEGSGYGDTASRGHKGAKSRSGYSKKIGFEGGQMPIQRRVPKFGFYNRGRVEYKPINLSTLEQIAEKHNVTTIDKDVLVVNGLASKHDLIKILGNGSLSKKLTVKAHAFSKSAKEAIEAQEGTAEKI